MKVNSATERVRLHKFDGVIKVRQAIAGPRFDRDSHSLERHKRFSYFPWLFPRSRSSRRNDPTNLPSDVVISALSIFFFFK